MIDIIGTIVILGLLALLGWERYQDRKERAKLFNAILAKNTNEFKDLELADNTKIKIQPLKNPNLIPINGLTDEDWYKSEIKHEKVR